MADSAEAHSTHAALDIETGRTAAEASTSGSREGRTWTDYWQAWFIPANTSGEEQHKRVKDATLDYDGYQPAAWEEEADLVYKQTLAGAKEEDFEDVAQYGFLSVPCEDLSRRPVVLLVARHLPANIVDAERLFRFCIARLDEVANAPYSVIYVHTAASYWENSPGALWLRSAYERLPVKYKMKLHKFYILHSDLSLWLSMSVVCPFMSHGFWSKVEFVPRVEFLWDHISQKKLAVRLPSFVHEHDEILEEEPLHDYGYVNPQKEMPMPGLPEA